jgi:hypothetical protein
MTMFEGSGGLVDVQTSSITVHRTDAKARQAEADIGPRTLPLAALSHVTFKNATRLTSGHIQLQFGGTTLVDAGSPEDPNMINFSYGQREAFAQAYEYLRHVVEANWAAGVDVAAVYADAQDPLVEWLAARDQAQETARAAEADRDRQAEAARLHHLAKKIGPDAASRRDIMAAAIASVSAPRAWLGIKRLPRYLHGGEQVLVIVEADYDAKTGIVVLTNQRLVFLRTGFSSDQIVGLRLGAIVSVSTSMRLLKGSLHVQTPRGDAIFDRVDADDLELLADSLRAALGAASRSARTANAPPQQADVLDQIAQLGQLHAAGVLTTAEFEAKKRQLLDRL